MDIRVLSHKKIIEIMSNNNHEFHEKIKLWFGEPKDYYDFSEDCVLVFSDDGIELNPGNYWLIDLDSGFITTTSDSLDMIGDEIIGLDYFISTIEEWE